MLWSLALNGAAAGVFAFMLLPLPLVAWLAFFQDEIIVFPPEGYSLRWFAAIWEKRQFVDGFKTSLQVGILAMLGDERARYGRIRLWGALGWGVVGTVGGLLVDWVGLRVSFLNYFVFMLILLLVVSLFMLAASLAGIPLPGSGRP